MPIHLKSLSCPHCHQKLGSEILRKNNCQELLVKRQAFPCPLCEQAIQLPERWEKVVSSGLLTAVILAPLSYYWQILDRGALAVFGLGAAMIVIGSLKQQLEPARPTNTDHR